MSRCERALKVLVRLSKARLAAYEEAWQAGGIGLLDGTAAVVGYVKAERALDELDLSGGFERRKTIHYARASRPPVVTQ